MSHTPRRIPQNRRLQLQHISDSLIWVCDAPYAPYIYICRTPHVAYPLPNYWCGYAPGMRRVFSGYAPWVCATGGIDRNRRKHMHLRVGFGASKDTGVLAAGHVECKSAGQVTTATKASKTQRTQRKLSKLSKQSKDNWQGSKASKTSSASKAS